MLVLQRACRSTLLVRQLPAAAPSGRTPLVDDPPRTTSRPHKRRSRTAICFSPRPERLGAWCPPGPTTCRMAPPRHRGRSASPPVVAAAAPVLVLLLVQRYVVVGVAHARQRGRSVRLPNRNEAAVETLAALFAAPRATAEPRSFAPCCPCRRASAATRWRDGSASAAAKRCT